jgi:hypothetical protein
MSNILSVDGKEYVSAIAAGKHFDYSKDYMLLLIKQGKIDGRKIGNKWYVHIPSAEVFFKESKLKRSLRRKEVSQIRKAELEQHTKVRKTPKHRRVLIETLAVLVVALTIGSTGYIGSSTQVAEVARTEVGFLERIALSLYLFVSPNDVVSETNSTSMSTNNTSETSLVSEDNAISAHVGTTTYTSIVVAPNELFTATTIDAVKESFSDEVEVSIDPHDPSTGIITPIFKNKDEEEYRFIMVPVTQNETSNTP